MPDPISAAGTAVGITSLGIQVSRELISYYNQFKSFHDDVSSAVSRAERLEKVLELIKQHLQGHPRSQGIADEALNSILDCEAGMKKLQILVKKCGEVQMPVTLEDKLRLVRKRLVYPFKKDALGDVNLTLDRLQGNLQLALQALQLYYNVLFSCAVLMLMLSLGTTRPGKIALCSQLRRWLVRHLLCKTL
jgi:hypothetical protein